MTVTDMAAYREMSDPEKRDAARRDALAEPDVTGKVLGERYGMTPEWGRKQKRAARGTAVPSRRTSRPKPGPVHGPPVPAQPERAAVPDPVTPEPAEPVVVRATGRLAHAVGVAGVCVVAAVAAVISYVHMRQLALDAGEGWRADILPLSVDGMMLVASMKALERRRAGRGPGAWACIGLVLGVAASLAANVAAAHPTTVGRLVAAWPPVALVIALELLLHQGDDQ